MKKLKNFKNNKRKLYMIIITILSLVSVSLVFILYTMKGNDNMSQPKYNPNVSPTLGYVELKVSNLERSLDFYQNNIGFKILKKEDNSVTLTADGKTPLLYLKEDKNAVSRPYGTTGLFHFAILVPTRGDLAVAIKRLIDTNYPLQGASDHIYSEALYLADPDNNGIEIYADRDPNTWEDDGKGGYLVDTLPMDVNGVFSEMGSKKWTSLPSDTKIGHMHLQVASIEESEKFYVDALGFDIINKDRRMLFISKDRYHHHIGMNTWGGVGLPKPPKDSLGLRLFIVHFTEKDFNEAKENLNKLGFSFEESENQILVEDPSGNTLKILNNKKLESN